MRLWGQGLWVTPGMAPPSLPVIDPPSSTPPSSNGKDQVLAFEPRLEMITCDIPRGLHLYASSLTGHGRPSLPLALCPLSC